MAEPNGVPHLLQQAGWRGRGEGGRTLGQWRDCVRHGRKDLGNSAEQYPGSLIRS
jgi:hypothetical protein